MVVSHWLKGLFPKVRFSNSYSRKRMHRRLDNGVGFQSGLVTQSEVLEDRTLLTSFLVDDDFTGATPNFGITSFDSIQDAINAAANGDDITVADGDYDENLTIDKDLELIGNTANPDAVNIIPVAGTAVTFGAGADGAIFRGFDIDAAAGTGVSVGLAAAGNLSVTLEDLFVDNAGTDALLISGSGAGADVDVIANRLSLDDAGANAINISSLSGADLNVDIDVVSGASAGEDGIHVVSTNSTAFIDITKAGDFSFAQDNGVDVTVTGGMTPDFSFNLSGTDVSKADFRGATNDGALITLDNHLGYNESETTFTITDANFNDAGANGLTIMSNGMTPGMESSFNGTLLQSSFNNANTHGVSAILSGNPDSLLLIQETTVTDAGVDGIHIEATDNSSLDLDIRDGDQSGAGNQGVNLAVVDTGSTVDLENNNDRGFEFHGSNGATLIARISGAVLSDMDNRAINGILGTLNDATMNLIVENTTIEFTQRDGINVTATGGSVFNATFTNTPILSSGRHGVNLNFDNSIANIDFNQGSNITDSTASNFQLLASNGSIVDIDFDATSSDLSRSGNDGIFASAVGAGTIVRADYEGHAMINDIGRNALSLNSQDGGRVNINALNGLTINDAGQNGISVFGSGANSTIVADNVTIDGAGGRAMQTIVGSQSRVINLLTNVHSMSDSGSDGLFFHATNSFLAIALSGSAGDKMDIFGAGGHGINGTISSNATMVLQLDHIVVENAAQNGVLLNIDGGMLATSFLKNSSIVSNGQAGAFSSGVELNVTNGGVVGQPAINQIGLAIDNVVIENDLSIPRSQDNGLRITADDDSYAKVRALNSIIESNDSDGVYVAVNPDESTQDTSLVDLTLGLTDVIKNQGNGVMLIADKGSSSVGNATSGILFNFNLGLIEENLCDGIEATATGDPLGTAANTTIVLNLNQATIQLNNKEATDLMATDGGIVILGITGGVFGDPVLLCADGPDSAVQISLNDVLLLPQSAPGGPAITALAQNGGAVVADFMNMTSANGTAISGHEGQAFVFLVETGGQLVTRFNNVEIVGNLTNAALPPDPKTGLPVLAAVQGVVRDSGSEATVDFTDVLISDHRLNGVEFDAVDGGVLNSTVRSLTLLRNNAAVGEGEFSVSVDQADSEANLDIDGLIADDSTGRGIDLIATSDALLNITQFTNVSAMGANDEGLNIEVSGQSQLSTLVISDSQFGGSLNGDAVNIDIQNNVAPTELSLVRTTANNARRSGFDINIDAADADLGDVTVSFQDTQAINAQGRGVDLTINQSDANAVDIDFSGINDFSGALITGVSTLVSGTITSPVTIDFAGSTNASNSGATAVNVFLMGTMPASVDLDGITADMAGTIGLAVQSMGAGVDVANVNVTNSSFDGAGSDAVRITLDDQANPTAILLSDVEANMSGGKGVDINLTNVQNGNTTVDLLNVNADQVANAGDAGLEITATGLLATDSIDVTVDSSSFDMAGGDGVNMLFDGAVGSAATVTMTDTGASDAGGAGLMIDATGGTDLLSASVTGPGSDFSRAMGGDGVSIHIVDQLVPTTITLSDVTADTAAMQGVDLSLTNVTGGESVVSLTNISAVDAQAGHGLDFVYTGLGATDSLDFDVNNANFSGAFQDAVHIELDGAVGSTAAVDIDMLNAGGAGDDGFDLELRSGVNATVSTFSNIFALNNEENGLKIHVEGGSVLTDFVADTLDLSGNGAGAGFDGIDVIVENAGSAATFNFASLTVNNSGGRGLDLDVFDNASLTFNVDGGTIDSSGLTGVSLNIASMNEFGTPRVVSAPATFNGTFSNLDVTNNGQSPVFTADGVEVDIQGVGTTANVNFDTLHADNNSQDGIDVRITDGANATVMVDNGSTGSNNGTAGSTDTGRGFSFFASGAATVANLSSASGPNGDNVFDNNLNGPGFIVDLQQGVTANFIEVNASASGNSQDGVRILANDGTGVTINDFTVSGSALQVNNNTGNGLFVDFNQINGINDFELSNVNVSGNTEDQIFVRFEGSTANPMMLGNFALHNINTTGTGASGDGIEIQLLDTQITNTSVPGTPPVNLDGFSVYNVRSTNNGGFGLNLQLREDPESSPIAPATPTSGITSGIITESEFDNNGMAGVRMLFSGDSVSDFEIYDNEAGFHNNAGQGVLIEVQDFATYTMVGSNPADFNPATRSFYNNTITNNGGVGFHVIASEPNDPDFFVPDGNGPRYDLDLGDILRNPNTITGNTDAAMAIIGGGDSTGSFTIRNAIMSNTTNGPDANLNGDGLVLRLNDYGILETLNVDGTASGLDINNNAGSGLVTSVNEDSRLGTMSRMSVLNTTIMDNALHGIDVQRTDDGLYGPDANNNMIVIGATGFGNTLQGNTQNGINVVGNNTQGGPIPFEMDITDNNLIDNLNGIFIRGTGNAQFIGNFSDNDFDAQNQDGIQVILENDASFGDPEDLSGTTVRDRAFILDGNQILNSARHGIFFDTNFTNESGTFSGGAFVNAFVRDSRVENDVLGEDVRTLISGNGGNGVQIIDNSDFSGAVGVTAAIQNTYTIYGTDITNNGNSIDNGNGIFVEVGERNIRDLNNGMSLIVGDPTETANNRDVQIIGNADDGIDLEYRDGDTNFNTLQIDRTTIRNNGANGDNQRNNDNGPQNVGHGIEVEVGEGEGNHNDRGNLIATLTNVDILQNSGDGMDWIVTTTLGVIGDVVTVTMLGVNSSQNDGRGLDVNLRNDYIQSNGGNTITTTTWNIGVGGTDVSTATGDINLINRFNENNREGVVFDTSARNMDQDTVRGPWAVFPHGPQEDINRDVFIEVNRPRNATTGSLDMPSTKHGYYSGDGTNHQITAGISQGTDFDVFTNNVPRPAPPFNPAGNFGTRGMQDILDIDGTGVHVHANVQIVNSEIANNGGLQGFEDGLVMAIGGLTRVNTIIANVSFGGNVGDDIRVYPQQSVNDAGVGIEPPISFRETGTDGDHSFIVYDPVAYFDLAFGILDSAGGFSPDTTAGNGRAATTATGGGGNGDQVTILSFGTSQTSVITQDGLYQTADPVKPDTREVRLASVVIGSSIGTGVVTAGGSDDSTNNEFVQNGVQQDFDALFGTSLFIEEPAFTAIPYNPGLSLVPNDDDTDFNAFGTPSGYDTISDTSILEDDAIEADWWTGLVSQPELDRGLTLISTDDDINSLYDWFTL